jgi:hypothetical protein
MIAETVISIELDGVKRVMFFNANTMVAFEEATGKFFLDTLASLYESFKSITPGGDANVDPFQVLKRVSMKDLRALLWAALHEYDAKGEPRWPLTLSQVGRMLTPESIPRVFSVFLKGQAANSPTKAEMGESAAPVPPVSTGASVKANGGGLGIDLPAGVFDLPEPMPEG